MYGSGTFDTMNFVNFQVYNNQDVMEHDICRELVYFISISILPWIVHPFANLVEQTTTTSLQMEE